MGSVPTQLHILRIIFVLLTIAFSIIHIHNDVVCSRCAKKNNFSPYVDDLKVEKDRKMNIVKPKSFKFWHTYLNKVFGNKGNETNGVQKIVANILSKDALLKMMIGELDHRPGAYPNFEQAFLELTDQNIQTILDSYFSQVQGKIGWGLLKLFEANERTELAQEILENKYSYIHRWNLKNPHLKITSMKDLDAIFIRATIKTITKTEALEILADQKDLVTEYLLKHPSKIPEFKNVKNSDSSTALGALWARMKKTGSVGTFEIIKVLHSATGIETNASEMMSNTELPNPYRKLLEEEKRKMIDLMFQLSATRLETEKNKNAPSWLGENNDGGRGTAEDIAKFNELVAKLHMYNRTVAKSSGLGWHKINDLVDLEHFHDDNKDVIELKLPSGDEAQVILKNANKSLYDLFPKPVFEIKYDFPKVLKPRKKKTTDPNSPSTEDFIDEEAIKNRDESKKYTMIEEVVEEANDEEELRRECRGKVELLKQALIALDQVVINDETKRFPSIRSRVDYTIKYLKYEHLENFPELHNVAKKLAVFGGKLPPVDGVERIIYWGTESGEWNVLFDSITSKKMEVKMENQFQLKTM